MRAKVTLPAVLLFLLLPMIGSSQDLILEGTTPGSEAEADIVETPGRIVVMTRPSHARVQLDGQPPFQVHPNRLGTLLERRARTEFHGLSIYTDHAVWLELPNYRGRRVLLPAYGEEGSRWEQHGDEFVIVLNEELAVLADNADEIHRRLAVFDCDDDAECQDLAGTITVQSRPAGANIRYAGQLLVDDEGQPVVTPATFSHYPSPDDGGQVPVTLEPGGIPLELELLGYHTMITGVFPQVFSCTTADPDLPLEPAGCEYTYDTGIIELFTPEEWGASP